MLHRDRLAVRRSKKSAAQCDVANAAARNIEALGQKAEIHIAAQGGLFWKGLAPYDFPQPFVRQRIFNHMAESPTFVIAATGVAIWFFSQPIKMENLILLIFAFMLTNLATTDVYPVSIRDNYILPHALKAQPCILIWLKIVYEQTFFRPTDLSTQSL